MIQWKCHVRAVRFTKVFSREKVSCNELVQQECSTLSNITGSRIFHQFFRKRGRNSSTPCKSPGFDGILSITSQRQIWEVPCSWRKFLDVIFGSTKFHNPEDEYELSALRRLRHWADKPFGHSNILESLPRKMKRSGEMVKSWQVLILLSLQMIPK